MDKQICKNTGGKRIYGYYLTSLRSKRVVRTSASFSKYEILPCGVGCPTHICLYYFQNTINNFTGTEREFWIKLLEFEHSVLLPSSWWSESSNGQRAFVPQKHLCNGFQVDYTEQNLNRLVKLVYLFIVSKCA